MFIGYSDRNGNDFTLTVFELLIASMRRFKGITAIGIECQSIHSMSYGICERRNMVDILPLHLPSQTATVFNYRLGLST